MFSLAIVGLPACSPAISSSTGATWRHGPHHSAQKSTRTGPSAPRTSVAKLLSVTVLVFAPMWDSPDCLGERPDRTLVEQGTGREDSRRRSARSGSADHLAS